MTTTAAPTPRTAGVAITSCVGLARRLEALPSATVLQMVARGGEALDPDRTAAGDYLRSL